MIDKNICVECGRTPERYMDRKHLCAIHYFEQYVPLSFLFHRDVPVWAKESLSSEENARTLGTLWPETMPAVTTHVFSRGEVHTVAWANNWALKHDHRPTAHDPPYSFRAWAAYAHREVVMVVDETETPASIRWSLYHELTHIIVGHMPLLSACFLTEDRLAGIKGYERIDDRGHEAHAEEQFCNRVATSLVGFSYDRNWWRLRADAQRSEETARALRDAVTARDEAAA